MRLRSLAVLLALAGSSLASAQLDFLGNTRVFATGQGTIPTRGGYIQPNGTLSVTAETFPIAPGQSVTAIVTTDAFATTREVPLGFDATVGNNTRWAGALGPFQQGTNVAFYLRANGSNGAQRFDNNGGQNYEATWRYAPKVRRGAILQWFSTDYKTILRRLPQVVEAGYGAIYLPPPQKSGGGGFSVGYNPFDRFDLGDRLQVGTVATRYGTTQELQELIRLAHRFGIEVYCDLVVNHNDNRAGSGIDRYPDLLPEDFHIRSSANTGNPEIDFNNAGPLSYEMLNHDLVGLVDLAHEDGNLTRTGPFNLPGYASFNARGKPTFVRNPLTPQYYPGDAVAAEDVRQHLRRACWFLIERIGFDGFRLDAVKHTPPAFFARSQTQAGPLVSRDDLLPYLYGVRSDLNVFGEIFSTNPYELREYVKTGIQALDFPLVDRLNSLFNANGFGDLGELSNSAGLDPATGLGYDHGGLDAASSVSFVQSHDNGPPRANNLATAFALTRPGSSVVYYDGNNLDPNDFAQFPRAGRFEALGDGSDGTTRLVDARARFARGSIFNRFVTSDAFVYERRTDGAATLLVALNDRGDTALTVTVATAFLPGTVLEDLSGQRANVVVAPNGSVTLTIPSNSADGNANNARGYGVYAPVTAALTAPIAGSDPATGTPLVERAVAVPGGSRASARSYPALVARGAAVDLSVATTAVGARAFVRLDNGASTSAGVPISGSPEGLTDGFYPMSGADGAFSYRLPIEGLTDGLHLARVRVFNETGARPGLYRDHLRWIEVRRGLRSGWVVDGDLAEFGPAAVFQSRAPSSSANRLDGLFLDNDDEYLYVGLAGSVDASPGFTNGMSLAIDTGASGVNDLATLGDDSGPASRLLSNTSLRLPGGFNARFALSSLRGIALGSAPEFGGGSPTVPPEIGAFAGAFRVEPATLHRLVGIPTLLAYQPRANATSSPFRGLEAAIPLRSLFRGTIPTTQTLRFLAWLGTTGEVGTTLPASDPAKGLLGGRPTPRAFVTNQFLPPQAGVTGDPGTATVPLTSSVSYALRRAPVAPTLTFTRTDYRLVEGVGEQTVVIRNVGTTTLAGPIQFTVDVGRSDIGRILNRDGNSLFTNLPYLTATSAGLAPGASVAVVIRFDSGPVEPPKPRYVGYAGRGAL